MAGGLSLLGTANFDGVKYKLSVFRHGKVYIKTPCKAHKLLETEGPVSEGDGRIWL